MGKIQHCYVFWEVVRYLSQLQMTAVSHFMPHSTFLGRRCTQYPKGQKSQKRRDVTEQSPSHDSALSKKHKKAMDNITDTSFHMHWYIIFLIKYITKCDYLWSFHYNSYDIQACVIQVVHHMEIIQTVQKTK